jgi:hypothetical protein
MREVVVQQPHAEPFAATIRVSAEDAQVVVGGVSRVRAVEAAQQLQKIVGTWAHEALEQPLELLLLLARELLAAGRDPQRRGCVVTQDPNPTMR